MVYEHRKIHDVHARHSTAVTTKALNRIGKLYAIESESRGSPAEERLGGQENQNRPADAVVV